MSESATATAGSASASAAPPLPSSAARPAVIELARDIKLSHSVFAMPYAVLGAFTARAADSSWGRFAAQFALIVGCMIAARTVAMLANRLIDRDLDARNPRTAQRALASRRVRALVAIQSLVAFAALFIALTAAFGFAFDNWWPFLLSIPVLAWISAYAYLKRFTWLCHAYLGSSLAISPLAAAIAVRPEAIVEHVSLWLLSGSVLMWVAGFDVIYALQDLEVDCAQRIWSIPSRFGARRGLLISRGMHVLSLICLGAIPIVDHRFGSIFWIAVALAAVLLTIEHAITAGGATKRIQLAFFTLNGIVSIAVGAIGVISLLVS